MPLKMQFVPVFAPSQLPLLILFFLITIATASDSMLLRYQSDLMTSGQWWRLITGHFAHLSWAHWLLNSLGLMLTAWLFNSIKAYYWHWSFLCSSLSVSFCLLWFEPQLTWYVGLSGVLHGFLIFGALIQIQRHPLFNTSILVVVIAKLIGEQTKGSVPDLEQFIGGSVVIEAHLYGAIGGGVAALPFVLFRQKKESRS